MQPGRRMAKEGRLLFEINVNAAEKNRPAGALIFLIQGQRQIQRRHQRRMAQLAQRRDQGVVPQARAAEHPARAGSYLHDAQWRILRHGKLK